MPTGDEDEVEDLPEEEAELTEQDSAVDPALNERKRARKLLSERDIVTFWRGVMANPVGRRVIWKILAEETSAMSPERFANTPLGFPDPLATYFYSGRRDVGMRLYQTLLGYDHAGVALMHREHDPNDPAYKPPKRTRRRDG